MPLIVLGVLIFESLFALIVIGTNRRIKAASVYEETDHSAPVIKLPSDLELEKRKRNII